MNKQFYLITWKEFQSRKLINKSDIVKTEDINDALLNLKKMNAQKRLTTTDYLTVNLSEIFKDRGLTLSDSAN